MGKVKGHFTELQSLGMIPTPEPTEEEMAIVEPSDDELAEIENTLDTTSWEDINWD
jgi:hypothetical protein